MCLYHSFRVMLVCCNLLRYLRNWLDETKLIKCYISNQNCFIGSLQFWMRCRRLTMRRWRRRGRNSLIWLRRRIAKLTSNQFNDKTSRLILKSTSLLRNHGIVTFNRIGLFSLANITFRIQQPWTVTDIPMLHIVLFRQINALNHYNLPQKAEIALR